MKLLVTFSVCILLLLQGCSNNKSATVLPGDDSDSARVPSPTKPISGKILTAKLTLKEPLVLKPSDHPDLVSHSPSAGLWTDGPAHPWKDDQGNTYINIPHSENYRYRIGNASSTQNPWFQSSQWQIQKNPIFDSRKDYVVNGVTYHRGGNCNESEYDNRVWIFSFWSFGRNVAAIAHHEWYAYCSKGYNTAPEFNRYWVNGIMHLTSSDGGSSFLPRALGAGNSQRLVIVPEPKNVQAGKAFYGFFHPSNIVQEGEYYYATAEIQDYRGQKDANGNELITEGFVIYRTKNISSPLGWEILDEKRNWVVMTKGYQGNLGQRPYIFFPRTFHPYTTQDLSGFAAVNLRYHPGSRLWLAFGVLDGKYTILQSESLSDPQFETREKILIQGVAPSYPYYISVFDPNQYKSATDLNYMNTGNTLVLLHMKDYNGYARYELELATEDAPPPTTTPPNPPTPPKPGPTPSPDAVLSFPLPKMFGFFKVGPDIYWGGTKTYCHLGSMDQYKNMTNSYDISIVRGLPTVPTNLQPTGLCGSPTGLYFVGGSAIYYGEKNEYCHVPSMDFFNNFTSQFPVSRIGKVAALPAGAVDRGSCR